MATRSKHRNVKRSVNPYNLRIVTWEGVDRSDYRTISSKGVTHFREGEEMDFTPLSDWKREFLNYHHLIKIKTFAKFQLWKAFSTWRKNIRRDIIHNRRKSLQEKLFFLNPDLTPALLTVSNECHAICKTQNLSCWRESKIYSKQAFLDEQYQQMSQVSFTLAKFREAIKFFVIKACQRVLLRNMFIPDEVYRVTQPELAGLSEDVVNLYETGLQKQEYCGALETRTAPLDTQDKSSYTEQAAKRVLCQRLSRFVRLTDYMILSALHGLSFNSLNSLLGMLDDCVQLAFAPKDLMAELTEKLRVAREKREMGDTTEEEEDLTEQDTSVKPVFKTSLRLEGSTLEINSERPPVEEFRQLYSMYLLNSGSRIVSSLCHVLISSTTFSCPTSRPIVNKS